MSVLADIVLGALDRVLDKVSDPQVRADARKAQAARLGAKAVDLEAEAALADAAGKPIKAQRLRNRAERKANRAIKAKAVADALEG